MVLGVFAFAQTVEKTYYFNQPLTSTVNGYDEIHFSTTANTGKVGEPSIPWQSVSLLLPQNSEAQDFTVEFSDFVELEGTFNLIPQQEMRQVGSDKEYSFVKDENLYKSMSLYPEVCQSKVMTQYMNGFAFATVSFTPVRYIPATGKVSYAKTATVKVNVTASKSNKNNLLWATPEVKARVERLAQNPEAIDQYYTRGRSIPGYELLVITPENWVSHFDEYVAFYEARGLRTHVTALEDILANFDGRDNQERMFNYIKQEYENEGIMMVLLGGDTGLVPFRGLYVYVSDEDQDNIPADMYFACFDVDWDANNNGVWGEVGESDYIPEIGIGRMCFNNEEQLNNLMHKTFSYQERPVLGEFRDVILGAEHLGDGYYGSTDLNRLIGGSSDFGYTTVGIPETYNIHKVYADGETGWSGSIFRNAINNYGGQYVHHVGHANTDYVAGWYANGITDATFNKLDGMTHNYNFFHSHGCICGDFSHGCILEKMTVVSTGFVVTTGNSRYGWYAPWGDGPAAHLHREFVDAYYNDRLPYIGTAFVEMKNAVAPFINLGDEVDPYLIWSFWALNIMGDVAICPWLDEPFTPEMRYKSALAQGTTETTMTITKLGEAQSNFRCSIFHNGELLAFGMTDENGEAEIQFNEPLNVIGEMQLIVTGPNAYPQTINILGIDNNIAYVIPENIDLSDEFHYSDTLSMSVDFKNVGNVNANNVTSTLSVESDYIEILNATANVGTINANATTSVENAFEIGIAGDIPDGTYVNFTLESTDGTNVWSDEILFRSLAPNLIINNITYEEVSGNGNDFIEPGEIFRVNVSGRNIGHKTALDCYLHGCAENPYVTYTENDVHFGDVEINGDFEQSLDMIISEETPDGTTVDLKFKAKTGQYAYEKHFIFTVGCIKEDFETGDFTHLEWEHSGDAEWFITDTQAHTGKFCAQSGEIGNDEITSLLIEITNTTDGTVSFFFKTSTEMRKDFLVFYIDNRIQERWSGENDWTFAEFDVNAGNHILEWRYDTSPAGLSEINTCWVDDITFPGNTTITNVESITYDKNISVYPNPANENIVVKSENIQTVEIFNTVGMKLYSQETNANELNINVSDFTNGVYFIKVTDDNNNTVITKFVKK